jgi:hypothetical protein
MNLHEMWDAEQTAYWRWQGANIIILQMKEIALYMKMCKMKIRTVMAIVSLLAGSTITLIVLIKFSGCITGICLSMLQS